MRLRLYQGEETHELFQPDAADLPVKTAEAPPHGIRQTRQTTAATPHLSPPEH